MEERIKKILDVIKDYRNDDGIFLTEKDIDEWAEQFGNDRDFVLDEFGHIIPQIYLSKAETVRYLEGVLEALRRLYKYGSLEDLLHETEFLKMQQEGKSQDVLLSMLSNVVLDKTGHELGDYVGFNKIHYVYLDDVMATGGTIGKHLRTWLSKDTNADDIRNNKKTIIVMLVCSHSLGESITRYMITQQFHIKEEQMLIGSFYKIENHLKFNLASQKLNIAIPLPSQSKRVHDYLSRLPDTADKYSDYTFRPEGFPKKEVFFTTPQNRDRYERIILEKGLDIIDNTSVPGVNLRPLGMVNPRYHTLGLGTHFFTWRNVPNNSPLVYWWSVPGHNWKPLFPKK